MLLQQYLDLRTFLYEKLDKMMTLPYSRRDLRLIEVLTDEIADVECAIRMMSRLESDKLGYRPRSDTLRSRPHEYW